MATTECLELLAAKCDRLAKGDSVKQVASGLGLSQHTVTDYAKSLHKKFGVNSRGELLARVLKNGHD